MCGIDSVAIDAPADGTVAEAYVAEFVNSLGEDGVRGEGDAVFDRDADWTFVGIGGWGSEAGGCDTDEFRSGSTELVGSVVGELTFKDTEAMDEGKRKEKTGRGGREGGGGSGVLGNEAPEDGAECHAALKCHEVGAQGAGSDPGWDGELDGGVDGGHGGGPG